MIKLRAFFRTDRGILWGTNAFFLALAIFLVGITWWSAALLKQSIQANFRARAEAASVQMSDAAAVNINSHFDDLAFIRHIILVRGTGHLLPSAKVLSAFVAFQHMHPSIVAINIQDPSGNRIVWSSMKQAARLITSGNDFSLLPGDVSRNRRKFRHSKSSPASGVSKSIILQPLWNE